jgi:hypothetical protein
MPGAPAREASSAEKALTDIRLVRNLLDQAERNAVGTARSAGASWTDVAVMLGVTRQAAWERWREVDDQAASKETRR